MTDRYSSLTVVLEKDIREDDAQALVAAIHQLRGVLTVEGNVANLSEFVIEQRVRQEFREKLWEVLR
jgi:inosine-uridine nucleoside N-ribohydrolase